MSAPDKHTVSDALIMLANLMVTDQVTHWDYTVRVVCDPYQAQTLLDGMTDRFEWPGLNKSTGRLLGWVLTVEATRQVQTLSDDELAEVEAEQVRPPLHIRRVRGERHEVGAA